jgi:uncharacterized OB-fold protein
MRKIPDVSPWTGPIPSISPETAPFWRACDNNVYLVQRCSECGKTQYHYRGFCAHCWSEKVEDLPIGGKGKVWSYSIVAKNRSPAFEGWGTYVTALIEVPEGVKLIATLVNCDPQRVRIGMPVTVAFADARAGRKVPVFVPDPDGDSA